MEASATVETLERFAGRGAGTDAERRAALWLAQELSDAGHETEVETFWCRPNWAMAQAWHIALAIVGSLVSVASPVAGIVLLGVALISTIADALMGVSPGRRLTPERASQNVVATAPPARAKTRLVLTANYDAGRAGLAYREALRQPTAALSRSVRGLTPGWLGWTAIAMLWLLAVAVLRLVGDKGEVVGALQLAPTVGLVLGFALLIELGLADWSPAAGDNASGVAAVLAVGRALSGSPPAHLDVELVLTGAGDQDAIGLHRYLRERKAERRSANTVVLGFAPCPDGHPRWWFSDGSLMPLRYARSLRTAAGKVAAAESHLAARPYRGRGSTPALPARFAGLPAIALGCLDAQDRVPRSHQHSDVAGAVTVEALDTTVQFALLLIDAVDSVLSDQQQPRSARPV